MFEKPGNKLSYVGNDEDGRSIYKMEIDDRTLFEAYAKQDEKGNPIYIRRTFPFPGEWTKTPLRAFVSDEGNGYEHITSDSMKNSIYGNLLFILADMILGPKN
jgi:hypothetical protein